MLRITAHDKPRVLSFRLEGRLEGPWVEELEKCWREMVARAGTPALHVDLTGVTFIDAAGKVQLAAMQREGAKFLAEDCLTKSVVSEISEAARRTSWIVVAAVSLITAGCMVGPSYEPPQTTLPESYREAAGDRTQPENLDATGAAAGAADDTSEIRWWRKLGDPQLTELVERAIVANYGVAIAQARLSEARAVRQAAQSLLSPQLSLGVSALRFRGSEAALGVADLEDSLFQLGFDASWALDIFGGNRRGVESAEATEQAVVAERRGVVLMVAAETARAYLEFRGIQQQLEIDQDILDQQRQTLTITEHRRRAGLASDLEVLRARTEVEATAAEIPSLQQASRQYIHLISTLLGLEPTALSDVLERPAHLPVVPEQIVVGIPSDLLRRRPDIQAAERQLAAATAQVGVATAELFPQVVLGASAGVSSRESNQLFNGNSSNDASDDYLAGPVINWTLFDGGRREAGIDFAEARVEAAKAIYQESVLRAFREVESSLVAVDRTRARVADLQRLLASARLSVEIARTDYERGLLDQLTVLDAQRQANRADLLLSQGEVLLGVNLVTLYKALGGGWEIAEPSPGTQALVTTTDEGDDHDRN